jgi:hypothetical protein
VLFRSLIETVFAKKNPPDAVLEGISRRLNLIETLLSQTSAAEFPSATLTIQLARSAAKGVDDLRELLASSSYDAGFHDLLATVIALTRQLIELGRILPNRLQYYLAKTRNVAGPLRVIWVQFAPASRAWNVPHGSIFLLQVTRQSDIDRN